MKTKLIYLFSLTVTMFLTACSNNDDVVDNVIPVIAISEPHDMDEFAPGGEIHFNALFTDNVALAAYKIEIHEDFDGHTHGVTKQSENNDNPWSYDKVFTISGGQKTFTAEQHIEIPELINGNPISEGAYHLGVFLTDAAGNESQAFREIHIETGAEGHDH